MRKKQQNHIYSNEQLSSPSLVGQNITKAEHIYETINRKEEVEEKPLRSHSPVKSYAKQTSPRHRSPVGKEVILRQPKKSEMAYFGVSVSPRSSRKEAVKKTVPKIRKEERRTKEEPKRRTDSPIYANIEEIKSDSPVKREFDASILEELTKAADQILQAVNGYTDDEETKNKNWRNEPLDTISETKSWKQQKVVQTKTSAARTANSKSKLKHTSSTSSVESVSRECRRNSNPRKVSADRDEKVKKKVTNNEGNTTSKALTKARRLQRASSREALLQSHGSSSEDLPANVVAPPRKPRLIKKTKTAQLTVTNGLEIKKSATGHCRKYEESKSKLEER